ncbi:FAD-dependent monooxygenase [Burkholderia lata]|uniref:Monooxygenase n=1 Tax=Burkholderia lata (strain ATCC 17760 / DSM 23089 / LMG 22485 / NCIMB 9086 / R18194 / 383) TaxID=482957 RepID=A0A6P2NCU7_BURL3|nr:FAD-dependent monooxygenase [Burkholderia lata]VWB90516.1 monooxygenase [Burkholderia lata]
MKIAIVGGGPSGLYLGLLLKRKAPDWQVDVIEQNVADATFGFGVVLADTGMLQLQEADERSYHALCDAMRYNDRQIIVQREEPIEIKLNVKGGAIPRLALLQVLQREAEEAGVRIHFGSRIETTLDLATFGLDDADVVVGADGINSVVRRQYPDAFGTTQRVLSNHFAWYGTKRVFEAPALVFRTFNGGHFVAHYYAYSDDMSTFVAECDDATWNRLRLGELTDDDRQHLFEEIFAPELDGLPLISNKSVWRQFPVIRNEKWVSGRHVLIGDALASAHFSIGSGTRIAMTDAIALARALLECDGDAARGLAAFEQDHKPQKNKLIDASERSYMWYEDVATWMDDCTPEEFVYQFMTRTGRIDDARLRSEFPELVQRLAGSAGVL